jgi:Ca2+-binding RTX toxin-like protein
MARIACAVVLALLGLAAPADAALCGYSAGTKTAAVAITPGTESTVRVNGTAIQVDGANCGAATTANTDVIDVNGSSADERLIIDLSGGAFAPGATAEGDGSAEIEFDVDLGANSLDAEVVVAGSTGADHLTAGVVGTFPDETNRINLNANEPGTKDADVTTADGYGVRFEAEGGNDVLSAAGGGAIGAYDYVAELWGEEGDDDLRLGFVRPGPGDDTIRGSNVPGETMSLMYSAAPGPVTITIQDGTAGNWGGTATGGDGYGDTDTYVDRIGRMDLTPHDDTFTGSAQVAKVTVHALGGDDTITGGSANDVFFGYGGSDTIRGGEGTDDLRGDEAGDFLYGEGGDDTLSGRAGADTVDGGPGDDDLREGGFAEAVGTNGADDLIGGTGFDELFYGEPSEPSVGRTAPVVLDLDGIADDGVAGEADNARADVEHVVGGVANDTLTGDGGPDVLSGLDGADVLRGGDGADELYGFIDFDYPFTGPDANLVDGGDDLDGGAGPDAVFGEPGDDLIEAREGTADAIACGAGTDRGRADRVDTIGGDCEAIDLPVEMPADPPVTPPVVVPPVVVPPVVTPPAPKVAALLSLPSSRRCASRRKFTVRVRREIRGTVKRVTIFLNGRRAKSVTGSRIGLPIDLRGLPKGKVKVRLRVELTDGRVATDTRTYRTCATKKRKGQFGRRRG